MLHARIIVAVDRDWPLFEADVVDSVQDGVQVPVSAVFLSRTARCTHKLTLREVAVVSSASGGESGVLVGAIAGRGSELV